MNSVEFVLAGSADVCVLVSPIYVRIRLKPSDCGDMLASPLSLRGQEEDQRLGLRVQFGLRLMFD